MIPLTIGRTLLPELKNPEIENSRPSVQGAARLESLKISLLTARAQNNQKIIREQPTDETEDLTDEFHESEYDTENDAAKEKQ